MTRPALLDYLAWRAADESARPDSAQARLDALADAETLRIIATADTRGCRDCQRLAEWDALCAYHGMLLDAAFRAVLALRERP